MSTEPILKLLVIDDQDDFLRRIERDFNAQFQLLCETSKTEFDELSGKVQNFAPDLFLLDVNLHQPGLSLEILKNLTETERLPACCKVWLMSQAHPDRAVINDCEMANANLQGRFIEKPISPRQLAAELSGDGYYEPLGHLEKGFLGDDLPIPFRVIDGAGKTLYHNDAWKRPLYPDTDGSEALLDTLQEREAGDTEEEYFHGDFFETGSTGFNLHSFLLKDEDLTLIGQIAERDREQTISSDIGTTFRRIFHIMQELAFIRGRYYAVEELSDHEQSDQYHQSLTLDKTYISGGYGEDLINALEKGTITYPMDGELKKRFSSYDHDHLSEKLKGKDSNGIKSEFIYTVRHTTDDPDGDVTINQMNALLGDGIINWLEIPIWIRDNTVTSGPARHRIAGILIFDRGGSRDSLIESQFDDSAIAPIVPILKSLVCQLTFSLRSMQNQQQNHLVQCMASMDLELAEAVSHEERFDIILRYLCDPHVSGATSAVLTMKSETAGYLDVKASHDSTGRMLGTSRLKELKFPNKALAHPIVKVWQQDQLPYLTLQDFRVSHHYREIQQLLAHSASNHFSLFNAEEIAQFGDWLDGIGSQLAIPIDIGGDKKRIGGITLQFDGKLAVTDRRLKNCQSLMQRARWVILYYRQTNFQQYWEQTLGHDLRGNFNRAGHQLEALCKHDESLENHPRFKAVKSELRLAEDQAENWLDLHEEDLNGIKFDQSISAIQSIHDFIDLNEHRIALEHLELQISPDLTSPVWQTLLKASKRRLYARVIRCLLDNAFKFGREHVDSEQDEKATVTIELEAVVEGQDWVFRVRNPGNPGQQELLRAFSRYRPSEQRDQHDGAHVCLHVSSKWVELVGGSLSLEKVSDAMVEAKLCWPMAE